MYIRSIFISLIGLFTFSNAESSNSWKIYEESALIISNQSPKVKELFSIAQKEKHITSENSKFDKAVKKSMDSMHYASLFDYHIDEESDR